jgi:hypothetical protein
MEGIGNNRDRTIKSGSARRNGTDKSKVPMRWEQEFGKGVTRRAVLPRRGVIWYTAPDVPRTQDRKARR